MRAKSQIFSLPLWLGACSPAPGLEGGDHVEAFDVDAHAAGDVVEVRRLEIGRELRRAGEDPQVALANAKLLLARPDDCNRVARCSVAVELGDPVRAEDVEEERDLELAAGDLNSLADGRLERARNRVDAARVVDLDSAGRLECVLGRLAHKALFKLLLERSIGRDLVPRSAQVHRSVGECDTGDDEESHVAEKKKTPRKRTPCRPPGQPYRW